MNSVGRLHTLLSGTQQGPSAKLAETLRCVRQIQMSPWRWAGFNCLTLCTDTSRRIFKRLSLFWCRACARDPSDVITNRLQGMFELFSQHFEGSGAENKGMGRGTCTHICERETFCLLCGERECRVSSPRRNGSEVLPPGGGAILQDPGVHHREREDDSGECWLVSECHTWQEVVSVGIWMLILPTFCLNWFSESFSVYSGAGCLPSLSAHLLFGDRHLLIQTSRRFPQLDQHLPAASVSLLQGTNAA